LLLDSLPYSPALKIEAARSSATSVNFYWTTRRRVPEDGILYSHTYENLKCQLFRVVINQCTKIISELGDLNLRTDMQCGGSHSLFTPQVTTEEGEITKYISKIGDMIEITKISSRILLFKNCFKGDFIIYKNT
jgi:hypothetical protein